MKPYLILVRSQAIDDARAFYTKLGFTFEQKSHEEGVVYYSANLGGVVFELYPCEDGEPASNNRLGFEISAESVTAAQVDTINQLADQTMPIGDDLFYAVLTDPDNRQLELVYPQPLG